MANPIKSTYPESENNYGFSASQDTFTKDPTNHDVRKGIGTSDSYSMSFSGFRTPYTIPYDQVFKEVVNAENLLYTLITRMEDNLLRKIYIDPYVDLDLESCHYAVWKEASQYMDIPNLYSDVSILPEDNSQIIAKDTPPSYICFDQYLYAEKSQTTACRKFINEYTDAISHSTFSYIFQIRKILKYMFNEIAHIKSSLLSDIGGVYDNESQQKIAVHYEGWAKKAVHYSNRISKTTGTKAEEIPQSELDTISKNQASKLQAFFAIRLNAVDSEIEDIISSLKRDLVDNSDVFYQRFLSPAIRITKDVSSSLLLDFQTTDLRQKSPVLSSEIAFASNIIQGNFISIEADYIERHTSLTAKLEALLNLIVDKKKYAAYITQLGNIASSKKKVLKEIEKDVYSPLFKTVFIDSVSSNNFTSNHSLLDGLDNDDHPQYLLKSGGNITGNITLNDGVTIDGVDIDLHSHNGSDGSRRIKSFDIDYETARVLYTENYTKDPVSLRIERFIETIEVGGIPRFDAVVLIEVLDETLSNHQYELLYSEIE
jgi:hypothetical protein